MTESNITFELVNDKAELTSAVLFLTKLHRWSSTLPDPVDYEPNPKLDWAWQTVITLVPRLMASYEEALELTYALADGWKSYMDRQTPAGLYVP